LELRRVLFRSVNDPDNKYPDDFTLQILPGSGYTVKGNSVSAARDFHGQLKVTVTVNDGELTSKPYDLSITVTPVNDAPSVLLEPTPLSFIVGKDRKSTRLNSSHVKISYAVFCL